MSPRLEHTGTGSDQSFLVDYTDGDGDRTRIQDIGGDFLFAVQGTQDRCIHIGTVPTTGDGVELRPLLGALVTELAPTALVEAYRRGARQLPDGQLLGDVASDWLGELLGHGGEREQIICGEPIGTTGETCTEPPGHNKGGCCEVVDQ